MIEWSEVPGGGQRLTVKGRKSDGTADRFAREIGPTWFNLDFEFRVDEPQIIYEQYAIGSCNYARGFHTAQDARTADLSKGGDWIGVCWASSKAPLEVRLPSGIVKKQSNDGMIFDGREEWDIAIPVSVCPGTLRFERQALLDELPGGEDELMRTLSATNPAFTLLRAYADAVADNGLALDPRLAEQSDRHIRELLVLAIETERSAARAGQAHHAIAAARFEIARTFMKRRLSDPALSLKHVADHLACSERSVQRLFAAEGTHFGDMLRAERLAAARRMLEGNATPDRNISDIAFACGFGDLSYFNRCYRARFGETPSDTRARTSG